MAGAKSNPQIVLCSQELVMLLRLALERGPAPPYAALAADLGLTASENAGQASAGMHAHVGAWQQAQNRSIHYRTGGLPAIARGYSLQSRHLCR